MLKRNYKESGYAKSSMMARRKTNAVSTRQVARANSLAIRRGLVPVGTSGAVRLGGAYIRSRPVGAETKYMDSWVATNGGSAQSTQTIITTGTIVQFSPVSNTNTGNASVLLIPQGTTKNSRIGNKLQLYQIRFNYTVALPAGTPAAGVDQIRLILYKDMQANGATATAAGIIDNGINGTVTVWGFQAMDNVDRYKIVKDVRIDLNANYAITTVAGAKAYHGSITHKCKEEIRYSSTTGVLTEIQSTNYGVLAITQNGNATLTGWCRVYWKDH